MMMYNAAIIKIKINIMLTIRLQRLGKIKQATYRVIISEKSKDPQADSLEILGNYSPKDKKLNVKEDRVKYWLSKGVQTSNTVFNMLLKQGLVTGKKRKSVFLSKSRKEKIAAASAGPRPMAVAKKNGATASA